MIKAKTIMCLTLGIFLLFSCGKNSNSVSESTIIGSQTWSKTNLDVETFLNGDIIHQLKSKEELLELLATSSKIPYWCYYNFDEKNGKKYGKLYNWYAVHDKRGLAPDGWHVAANSDWQKLFKYLGNELAGTKLKSPSSWDGEDNVEVTNSSNFLTLPGGSLTQNAEFERIGEVGSWWSTCYECGTPTDCHTISLVSRFKFGDMSPSQSNKMFAHSVRLVMDDAGSEDVLVKLRAFEQIDSIGTYANEEIERKDREEKEKNTNLANKLMLEADSIARLNNNTGSIHIDKTKEKADSIAAYHASELD